MMAIGERLADRPGLDLVPPEATVAGLCAAAPGDDVEGDRVALDKANHVRLGHVKQRRHLADGQPLVAERLHHGPRWRALEPTTGAGEHDHRGREGEHRDPCNDNVHASRLRGDASPTDVKRSAARAGPRGEMGLEPLLQLWLGGGADEPVDR